MSIKPFQLQLKVVWFGNFLGLAIDNVNLNQIYSLTPYYFWPKTEAWEQLKLELGFKPWLKDEEKIRVLNSAAEIMVFWRAHRNTTNIEEVMKKFNGVRFVKINT